MARTEIPLVVIDPATGNAIVGASVAVAARATGTASTVYAGETGGTTVTNPRTTDAYGRLTGWVERGAYTLTVSGGGLTTYVKNWDSAPAADSAVDALWAASAVVTALPGSPINGQVCLYQSTIAGSGGGATATMESTGTVWALKYRSASASAYKWEVIGAAPISHASAGTTSASVASATWSQISATLDPRVTVPLAGDYYVRHAAGLGNTTAGTNAIGVKLNTTEAGAFDATSALGEQTAAAAAISLSAAGRVTMATASTVILQRFYKGATGSTTLSAYNASLSVLPIRVA